jgi:type I restriction enzyme M protein
VLAGVDYNDERKLGDAKQRDQLLLKLEQHLAQVDLRNSNLSEPDMLGLAYEYLNEKNADDAGKKGGEFYTQHMVVRLIVELLQPTEGMRICDPTCGSGGMLIQSAGYVERHGGNRKNLSLFGQEKNLGTWAICKMNMLLHGFPDARIEKGDTIRDPKLLQDGELMLFDRVFANPPFSHDSWGREEA